MHRFLLSAAHKSSGKTTVSIGLCAALRASDLDVQPFKKGPDYIDPLWLSEAAGRTCRNLDFHLAQEKELTAQFARYGHAADVCLVEGNKGLYDGLDLHGANSNAALARLLDLPVVLVLDARGMTRGIAPLILGYQAFDRDLKIAGVILNRLGGSRHEAKLRAVIEHYTDVAVLGAIQEDQQLALCERHLGLIPANESSQAAQRIAAIGTRIAAQVDLDRLLSLTQTATILPTPLPTKPSAKQPVRIAIARDAAFGFYYADDLDAFAAAGAELIPFDTLRDAHLPDADGLFIGGGFPESFLDELEANASLRAEIGAAIGAGLPAYAECGGLMYLARSITWKGRCRRMVGSIEGDVVMHAKPVGRGYVRLAATAAHPWLDDKGSLPAHEFHYSSIEGLGADTRYAYRMERGHGIDGARDGIVHKNLLASYTHLRSTAACNWVARFVAHVRACKAQQTPQQRICQN
ncbi:MAG: cobyrinate a,c-diamide synthase [Betaproteobacteria bacterium]|nr:cobyrinate a,c-diamide synthase [Betaproteobacteria bacterium]